MKGFAFIEIIIALLLSSLLIMLSFKFALEGVQLYHQAKWELCAYQEISNLQEIIRAGNDADIKVWQDKVEDELPAGKVWQQNLGPFMQIKIIWQEEGSVKSITALMLKSDGR